MKKTLFLAVSFFFSLHLANAQHWDWARAFAANNGGFNAIALSHDDHLYVAGRLQDTLWLGADTLVSPGQSWWLYGSFLAKFDTAGTLIWSKFLGTDYGFSQITEGADHHLYLGGGLRADSVTLNGTTHRHDQGYILLAKMTPDGDFVWARNFADRQPSGTNRVELGRFSLDAACNLYLCGTFQQKGYFGPDTLLAANGTIFVSKMDSTGAFAWTAQAGNNQPGNFLRAAAIEVDTAGNAYVVGRTQGAMNFGPHTFTTPSGRQHGFLARYDQQGNCVWVRPMGPPASSPPLPVTPASQPADVRTDAKGDVYITGFLEPGSVIDSIVLPPDPDVQRGNFFLAKFTADGHALWVRRAEPGSQSYSGQRLFMLESGALVVTGSYANKLILQTDTLVTTYAALPTTQDFFLAEYTANGAVAWAANADAEAPGMHLAVDRCEKKRLFGATAHRYYPANFGGLDLPAPDKSRLLLLQFSFPNTCPVTTAAPEPKAESAALRVYPNPTGGWLTVDFEDETASTIIVRDFLGQVRHRQSVTGKAAEVQLPMNLPAGAYRLEVQRASGQRVEGRTFLLVR